MVRLNRNKLSQKQLDDLFKQLSKTIAPEESIRANGVLTELLGKEERLMVAKRLAVVVLLVEGVSMYRVGRLLKLSPSTVEGIFKKINKGHFDQTLGRVSKTKKDYFAFLNILDDILHLGGTLPHYNGLDRYKCLR